MIRINKIKFDGAKVRIEYQKKRPDQASWDEFSLHSADLPSRDFIAALEALSTDVITICELAPEDLEKVRVRGVTITHTNEITSAVITALKTLKTANAPLVINTPHLPAEPYSEGGEGPLLPSSTVGRVDDLILAAEKYLNGERAQGDLLAQADVHDALSQMGGEGVTVSIGVNGGPLHDIDPEKHGAMAADLRAAAGDVFSGIRASLG